MNIEVVLEQKPVVVEIDTQIKYAPKPREPTESPNNEIKNNDFPDILTLYELAKI